jgi:hypothetical protein
MVESCKESYDSKRAVLGCFANNDDNDDAILEKVNDVSIYLHLHGLFNDVSSLVYIALLVGCVFEWTEKDVETTDPSLI